MTEDVPDHGKKTTKATIQSITVPRKQKDGPKAAERNNNRQSSDAENYAKRRQLVPDRYNTNIL